jgi:hypothetical protein
MRFSHHPSSQSATTLLPGQDNSGPSRPMSGASYFVVLGGFRLSEVGFSEFRKPQVKDQSGLASGCPISDMRTVTRCKSLSLIGRFS